MGQKQVTARGGGGDTPVEHAKPSGDRQLCTQKGYEMQADNKTYIHMQQV